MAVDKWVNIKNAAISPETVCELLNECELRGEHGTMVVRAGTVRELVTVWLRVAALYEALPDGAPDHELISTLLFGAPSPDDTEPNGFNVPTPEPEIVQ